MVASQLKQGVGKELQELFGKLTATISDTLGSLVGRDLAIQPSKALVQTVGDLASSLPRACAIAKGDLSKDLDGKTFLTLFELPDAIAMSGLLMMTPDDIIAERRDTGTLDGEDTAAFSELGNVLYSSFNNLLEEKSDSIGVAMSEQGIVEPGSNCDLLGSTQDRLFTFTFRMKLGEFPESIGTLAVDLATAEAWNGAPLETSEGTGDASSTATRLEDDQLNSIPAAPIRGTLAAFVMQTDAMRTLRLSCRRVGLEMRRHGRTEIPNPAAHRNEVVVLDVPPGHDRRFDWCRRIKELSPTSQVVLLIHHPSRARVTQAFLSKADAIVGFPCEEQQLSQKLTQLLDPPPAPDTPESESES